MGELIHTSRVKIYQDERPERRAYIEEFGDPITFGVHSGVKRFYGYEPKRELPTTLDHMVAAVGGWLIGTLAGALAVRQIPPTPEKIWSEVEGDIEKVDGIIRIVRIRVRYHLKIPKGKRETAERALSKHMDGCPAAMSVKDSIEIHITSEIEEER